MRVFLRAYGSGNGVSLRVFLCGRDHSLPGCRLETLEPNPPAAGRAFFPLGATELKPVTAFVAVTLESCWGVLFAHARNTTTGWSAGASASCTRALCVDILPVQVTGLISVLIPGFEPLCCALEYEMRAGPSLNTLYICGFELRAGLVANMFFSLLI